jgi:hypothetical protein
MANSNKLLNGLVLVVVALVALGIGYSLGKISAKADTEAASAEVSTEASSETSQAQPGAEAQQASGGQAAGQSAQQPEGMTAAKLAKLKNVPETVESPQGDFTLVTVIEGEDQNRFLRGSLQAIGNQRQNLAILTRRFNEMGPQMAQQKELIAGEINQLRQALDQNLRFMAQNFGYTLANNYLLVPHKATLNSVIGTGEDQLKTVVYTFENSESYKEFQEKTDAYAKMKRDQVMAYRETLTEAEKSQPLPKMQLTEEMKTARDSMIKIYKCDPEKTYVIEIQKAALYFRRAQ